MTNHIFGYLDGEIDFCPAVSVLIEMGSDRCPVSGDRSVVNINLIHGAN